MWTPQQKVQCVLWLSEEKSVTRVQRRVRRTWIGGSEDEDPLPNWPNQYLDFLERFDDVVAINCSRCVSNASWQEEIGKSGYETDQLERSNLITCNKTPAYYQEPKAKLVKRYGDTPGMCGNLTNHRTLSVLVHSRDFIPNRFEVPKIGFRIEDLRSRTEILG
ncbi:hypothetical protein ANN_04773 [Periplaneta americana]|uniref:Uncharacterized protein n=1 Tax=Periplaneta americana TaxID=6978 RepID=A0ABQ8TA49_PERAM|nr:hypothetical protein ANN_04773 [Periplaneta americana]